VTITGNSYAEYQTNVAALLATGTGIGYGWTALGQLKLLNGVYTRTFQQFFPLLQWNNSPSVYGTWNTRIPRVYSSGRILV
jgi:hypothetical protein